jgi:hypothetical protein
MPLSFLASFFALNVDGFPRSVDGGVEFGLPWVAGLICKLNSLGISLSFAYIADFEYSWCDCGIRRAFRDRSLLLRRAEWKRTSSQPAAPFVQAIYISGILDDF